jgi:hypothetical protein
MWRRPAAPKVSPHTNRALSNKETSLMRKTIIIGLTTALSTAAIAAPAMAQSPAPAPTAPAPPASVQNAANAPQLHVGQIKVQTSKRGYVIATVPISAINMGHQTVSVDYRSNMKTFEPATGGEFAAQKGKFGVPGNAKVYKVYSFRLAIHGKTAAQVRKSLKVTISNPTNGAVITAATGTAS